MRGMMKWISPVMAVALMIGFSGITTRADDAPKPAVGTISGTVTDKDGKPAANVTVNLLPAPTKTATPAPAPAPKTDIGSRTMAKDKGDKGNKAKPVATTTTGADGSYTLPGIPVGDYQIEAGDRKAGTGYVRKPVTVKEGDTLTIALQLTVKAAKKPAN